MSEVGSESESASQQKHSELERKFLDLTSRIQGFGDQQQREFNRTNDAIRGLRSEVHEGGQRLQEAIKESIQTFGIQSRLLIKGQSYLLQDQNRVPEVDKNGVRRGGNGAIVDLILNDELRVGDEIYGTSIESRTLGNHLNGFRLLGLKLAEDPAGQIYLVVIERVRKNGNGYSRTTQIHSGYDPLGNPIQTLYFKKHQVPESNKKLWDNHNAALKQMLDLSDFNSSVLHSASSSSHESHASYTAPAPQRKRPRLQGIQRTSAVQNLSSAAPVDPRDVVPTDPRDVVPTDPRDVFPTDPRDVFPTDPRDVFPTDPSDLD